jgi:hypothetical protein
MKAMCQAAWLLTVAFGNLVVIIVAEGSLFNDRVRGLDVASASIFQHAYILVVPDNFVSMQAIEFFFFAGLIFVVTIIFAIMSFFYKYVDLTGRDDETSPSSHDDSSQDESSALIAENGTRLDDQKRPPTSSPPAYVAESEGEQKRDKSGGSSGSGDGIRSESGF